MPEGTFGLVSHKNKLDGGLWHKRTFGTLLRRIVCTNCVLLWHAILQQSPLLLGQEEGKTTRKTRTYLPR